MAGTGDIQVPCRPDRACSHAVLIERGHVEISLLGQWQTRTAYWAAARVTSCVIWTTS
jgi:hypothetical protein